MRTRFPKSSDTLIARRGAVFVCGTSFILFYPIPTLTTFYQSFLHPPSQTPAPSPNMRIPSLHARSEVSILTLVPCNDPFSLILSDSSRVSSHCRTGLGSRVLSSHGTGLGQPAVVVWARLSLDGFGIRAIGCRWMGSGFGIIACGRAA